MNINDLCRMALAGDAQAEKELFEKLSARFGLLVRRKVGNRQDCEEIVQNALMKVHRSFRATTYETSFAAWAQKVLENTTIDFFRRARTAQREVSETYEGGSHADSLGADPTVKMALLDCLRKVNAVNRRHARMLVLSYQGFKVDEICERLKLTRGAAYTLLSRARSMLATCLKKGDVQ